MKKLVKKFANKFGKDIIDLQSFNIHEIEVPENIRSKHDNNVITVHMFWAYGDFTNLERLSAASFIANGFNVKLWTYGSVSNLPNGVQKLDALDIIPESRVFKYQNGSFAGFANLFRYAVLCREGGLWADTDTVCLAPASALKKIGGDGFLVTERTSNSLSINNNVIYHPFPKAGDIIDLAYAVTDRFHVESLDWGDCGPRLLTALIKTYPKLATKIMGPDFANPINWWDCPEKLITGSDNLCNKTWFVHCFNEMWRQSKTNKNMDYPRDSTLGKLFSRYRDSL